MTGQVDRAGWLGWLAGGLAGRAGWQGWLVRWLSGGTLARPWSIPAARGPARLQASPAS